MGLEGRGTATPTALLVGAVIIVLASSSELSKTIKDLHCRSGQHLLLRRATFHDPSICQPDLDHSQPSNASLPLVDCFGLSLKKLRPRFSLELLREVYSYVDTLNETILDKINKKLEHLGKYTVNYDCIDTRRRTVNPCADSDQHADQKALFFLSSGGDKKPCKQHCQLSVVQHRDKDKRDWEHQFLLKEGEALANGTTVSYRIDHDPKSRSWRRLNQTHLVTERLPARKNLNIEMNFSIENESEVARIWINFPNAHVTVACQHLREKFTTTTPSRDKTSHATRETTTTPSRDKTSHATREATTAPSRDKKSHATRETTTAPSRDKTSHATRKTTTAPSRDKTTPHQHPPTNRKRRLYRTLLVIPAVLAFLAVVIGVVHLVLKRSETRRSRVAESRRILDVGPVPQRPRPAQARHSVFTNQAFLTDSFNASRPTPPAGPFPPLTGNGRDDRLYGSLSHQYGTLDYHGSRNRRGDAEDDDYNHIPVHGGLEMDGYERLGRDRRGQTVIDNPYNHTHTS